MALAACDASWPMSIKRQKMIKTKNGRQVVWWIWGGMDALYITWFIIDGFRKGKVPYLTDAISALELLRDQDVVQMVMVSANFVLQLSIFISCILFCSQRQGAKLVGYLQLPLRLVFLVPSVSVLLTGVQFFPGYNLALMMILIAVSEMVKGWSLWFFGRPQFVR